MSRSLRRGSSAARLAGLLITSVALGCVGDPYGDKVPPPAPAGQRGAPAAAVPSNAAPPAKSPTQAAPAVAKPKSPRGVPTKHEDGKPLAKVLASAPLPFVEMLGQDPAKAESHLGPPLTGSKGGMRDACVRYLPERTWFKCRMAWQRYSDKTKTFGVVHMIFEDSKVSGIAFEKIPGSGEFDPRKALKTVGLELPGEPKLDKPQPEVTVWSWWNSSARLLVHGRQYRVRVSTVSGTWDTAKVEIILNDVLSDAEKARVFEVGAEPPKASPAD